MMGGPGYDIRLLSLVWTARAAWRKPEIDPVGEVMKVRCDQSC